MKKLSFLTKLKNEDKLKLVEISEEISKSYLIKSDKCIKVAMLAYNAEIYENAISEAYYAIYNSVLSLFYRCGIKCENHSGSVLLIKDLYNLDTLHEIFFEFKKDRIDNQYYVPIVGNEPINKEQCLERLKIAKEFTINIRAYTDNLNNKEIAKLRERFEKIN